MNWNRDRDKKILGTKGLSQAIRQNPAFIKFREANLEQIQTELEAKRKSPPELPPELVDFDPESIIMKTFLNTQEGMGVAERVSIELGQIKQGRDFGDSSSNKPIKDAARRAKVQNLDWELVGRRGLEPQT
jgi:hypothetical protein